MNIVITMAGEGSRFKKVGFSQPKYEIMVNGKSMFEWAMLSLRNFFTNAHFVFVSKTGTSEFIEDKLKRMSISGSIIETDQLTSGQAETAKIAIETLDPLEQVAIYNIDTFVSPTELKPELISCSFEGWIPVFEAEGEHWSFAEIDKTDKVIQVAEKIRISNFATIGFYYFSSGKRFLECYEWTYIRSQSNYKETYVAPMYEALILNHGQVFAHVIDRSKIIPIGTPDELAASSVLLSGIQYE
ncbi:glycosyltransferase family 2 protein [Paenibacillus turpanensis]|uniref:glycosyltransferase family 2 protein n=1 Tax=Paenibacillus turpanensis TaxID=2689078 RepID=UPI00140E0A3A|nr:glycosyltransferase family 2 protein [Paenibacillus turpanensis]